jgi:hypothetical protein
MVKTVASMAIANAKARAKAAGGGSAPFPSPAVPGTNTTPATPPSGTATTNGNTSPPSAKPGKAGAATVPINTKIVDPMGQASSAFSAEATGLMVNPPKRPKGKSLHDIDWTKDDSKSMSADDYIGDVHEEDVPTFDEEYPGGIYGLPDQSKTGSLIGNPYVDPESVWGKRQKELDDAYALDKLWEERAKELEDAYELDNAEQEEWERNIWKPLDDIDKEDETFSSPEVSNAIKKKEASKYFKSIFLGNGGKELDPRKPSSPAGPGFLSGAIGSALGYDGMVCGIPIEHVIYYDFAESDSIVKYRSFGGEFFAHQGGDKTALRVDFLLVGPMKEVYMNALRLLRLSSKSTVKGQTLTHQDESYLFKPAGANKSGLWSYEKITKTNAKYDANFTKSIKAQAAISGVTLKSSVAQMEAWGNARGLSGNEVKQALEGQLVANQSNQEVFYGVEPSANVDVTTIERVETTDKLINQFSGTWAVKSDKYYELQKEGYYVDNLHYPVIIKNTIFPDMWLETVQFTHDSRNGIDAIIGHMLLRKYVPPSKVHWSANGKNPSAQNTSGTEQDKKRKQNPPANGKSSAQAFEKWVWTWEEKADPTHQIREYQTSLEIGVVKAGIQNAIKPYQYMNIYCNAKPDFGSIMSRVVI